MTLNFILKIKDVIYLCVHLHLTGSVSSFTSIFADAAKGRSGFYIFVGIKKQHL